MTNVQIMTSKHASFLLNSCRSFTLVTASESNKNTKVKMNLGVSVKNLRTLPTKEVSSNNVMANMHAATICFSILSFMGKIKIKR